MSVLYANRDDKEAVRYKTGVQEGGVNSRYHLGDVKNEFLSHGFLNHATDENYQEREHS